MKKIFIVACCLMSVSSRCQADNSSNVSQKRTVDTSIEFLSPGQVAIGASVAILGSSLLDRTIRDHLFPFRNVDPSEDLRHLGDYGQVAGPVLGTGFLLQGLAFNNAKSKETAILSYESFIVAGALGGVVKFLVGRKRPESTDNPFKFKPGGSDSSFPSGHTTEAFAAATVFSEQYPHWYVAIPSYAAASTIGFSRMYANKHWMSDVVAGAFLGTVVSHELRIRRRHSKEYSWQIETNGSDLKIVRKF